MTKPMTNGISIDQNCDKQQAKRPANSEMKVAVSYSNRCDRRYCTVRRSNARAVLVGLVTLQKIPAQAQPIRLWLRLWQDLD